MATVGAAILFLVVLSDNCSLRYQYTDFTSKLEYRLSYCGTMGDFCEIIVDPANDKTNENCDVDPNYMDSSYIGGYDYLQSYADSI